MEMEKLIELEYNEFVTLTLIESNKDLLCILSEEVEIPINLLLSMSSEDLLNSETKTVIRNIFETLILTQSGLANKYMYFAKTNNISLEVKNIDKIPTPVIEKPKKITAVKTIPKRYGAEKIKKDIEKQGGESTPLQRAMLSLNILKNITTNLNNRGIKDIFTDTNILTDDDCRTIISLVKIAEQKFEAILKKK